MPFDGTSFHAPQGRNRRRRGVGATLRLLGMGCGLCFGGLAGVAGASDFIWPDRGLITLLRYGITVERQNIIGYELMVHHSRRLHFAVGDHHYTVMSPAYDLPPDLQKAWLGYAKWKGYPAYPADGPGAIDP